MIKAARKASRGLLRDFGEVENLQVSSKAAGDFVSKADIKAEATIFAELSEARPNYGWLGEESSEKIGNDPTRRWIVDPLDGTANYNRDIPICCVSIGMVKNMKPLFGVIYDFNSDEIYCGDCINKVATLNNSPIQVSKVDDKKDGILITGLPFNTDYSDASLNNLISDMQSWKKTRMIGSAAMASCYIASGKAELYKEKGIYLWDILAGAAIVEAAGGLAEIKNVRDNYQVDVTFSNQKIKG